MLIRNLTPADIPVWLSLSKEYDRYVAELVADLTEWYDGGEDSIAFGDYMSAKISQGEAFLAEEGENFGIIAISKRNNRITFFGVSHLGDFFIVGEALLNHALLLLDKNADISVNIIKSISEQIQKEYDIFTKYGFRYFSDGHENGVPVSVMIRACLVSPFRRLCGLFSAILCCGGLTEIIHYVCAAAPNMAKKRSQIRRKRDTKQALRNPGKK